MGARGRVGVVVVGQPFLTCAYLSPNNLIPCTTSTLRKGFGILAQPTEFCKDLDPTANVVLHQADIGEYLRVEDELA